MKLMTRKILAGAIAAMLIAGMTACSAEETAQTVSETSAAVEYLTRDDITVNETFTNEDRKKHTSELQSR